MIDQIAELTAIEQKLVKAWVESDFATIESLLDDDWSVTDPRGRVMTKSQVLGEAKTGTRKIESGSIDDIAIRSFGDVAVVTGKTTATGSYQGDRVTVKLRFTDVCVKRGETWRVVASQGTLISE